MLTWALLAPSCIGLIHQFFPEHHFEIQTTFCVSYILWAFGFMEVKIKLRVIIMVQEATILYHYCYLCSCRQIVVY